MLKFVLKLLECHSGRPGRPEVGSYCHRLYMETLPENKASTREVEGRGGKTPSPGDIV